MTDSTDKQHGIVSPMLSEQPTGEDLPAPMPGINQVPLRAPIDWLKRGWQDMKATGFKGCFYGALFVLMGYAVVWVYATKWQLTMGLIGGFFLMGPFLCTGIYDLSRQQEKRGKASLIRSFSCWSRNLPAFGFFSVMLTFVMIVWARVSLVLFALTSTTSLPTVKSALTQIFSFNNPEFLLIWGGAGFVFASLVFALGAISAPMILDRKSDTFVAVFSSARSLKNNPRAMYFWAAMIVVIIGLSLIAGFFLLFVTAPLVGHATWHAYRDLVASSPEEIATEVTR